MIHINYWAEPYSKRLQLVKFYCGLWNCSRQDAVNSIVKADVTFLAKQTKKGVILIGEMSNLHKLFKK